MNLSNLTWSQSQNSRKSCITCFDDDVDLETIKKIAELNPLRIVFKDSSFKDDAAKVNCDEYLKNKLPSTIVKVV